MSAAEEVVRALDGRWHQGRGMCRCPAHDDHDPSLSVRATPEGRVLVYCFAGCDQADVIAALKRHGLWPGARAQAPLGPPGPPAPIRQRPLARVADFDKLAAARRIWGESRPIAGTPAEAYLRARGITVALPDSLRFHPRLKHGFSQRFFPALVAAVVEEEHLVAVHRTFLDPRAPAKAPVYKPKLLLGLPPGSGAVRLERARLKTLGLAEGIETGLSARQLTGLPVWCALGDRRLPQVAIPPSVRRLVIFSDAGLPGQRAAEATRALHAARGLTVILRFPLAGRDFNDMLRALASQGAAA